MGDYLLFLMVLLVVAAVVRGDFAFTVLYLFLGAFLLGRWWSGKALTNVTCQRFFESTCISRGGCDRPPGYT